MATMLGNTYSALVEAGASQEKAQTAAEELADYDDSRLSRIEGELLRTNGELSPLNWMSGTTLALVVAVLIKLFVH